MPSTTCGFQTLGNLPGSSRLVFYGPTLIVDIGFDAAFHPGSNLRPTLAGKDLGALVDTGASESCIDGALAMQLQLPIVNQRQMAGVHGARMMNMHLGQIHVPALNFTVWGEFAGADLAAGGQPHRAILGRTFLRHFKMIYDGSTGLVTIESP